MAGVSQRLRYGVFLFTLHRQVLTTGAFCGTLVPIESVTPTLLGVASGLFASVRCDLSITAAFLATKHPGGTISPILNWPVLTIGAFCGTL